MSNRIIAWGLIGLILILVPTARTLQRALKTSLESPWGLWVIFLLLAAGVGFGICCLMRYKNVYLARESIPQLVLLLSLLGIAIWVMVNPIQLTHLVLYALLTLCWKRELDRFDSARWGTVILASIVSLVDESFQGLHPERYFDFHDLLLNFIGSLIGLIIVEIHDRSARCRGTTEARIAQL